MDPALKRIQSYLVDYIAAISIMCTTLYSNDLKPSTEGADCKKIPIIIHGYDCPKPSGKGYRFYGIIPMKGPWLRPAFQNKKQEDKRPEATLARFIDDHNENLIDAAEALNSSDAISNHVCYLNLRGVTTNWADELHPGKDAMKEIAKIFDSAIKSNCEMVPPVEESCLQ